MMRVRRAYFAWDARAVRNGGDHGRARGRGHRRLRAHARERRLRVRSWDASDNNALSPQARLGQDLFFEKAGCGSCLLGENFTGGVFHNRGVGWNPRTTSYKDDGRFLVTKNPRDRGAFKVPGLRDVSRRAGLDVIAAAVAVPGVTVIFWQAAPTR